MISRPISRRISTIICTAIRRNEGRLRRRLLLVACLNRANQHHKKAASFASQNQRPIVTTTWVLTEVADAFAASTARNKIAGFVAWLEGDVNTKIVPATQALFHRGLERYAAVRTKIGL